MEGNWRWALVAAVAPIAWGANYYVTSAFLPPESPLWGSVLRALPAGIVLLAMTRTLPRGSWWWRSTILGTLNVGAFFTLIYVAAQRLPSSLAATLMATSAGAMILIAWLLLSERPRKAAIVGALVGITGVAVMLLGGAGDVDPVGVAASLAAMVMSSIGFVLTKRWADGVGILTMTSWQLTAGGLALIPVAVIVEGSLPTMTATTAAAFVFVALVATAVAYAAWFAGLRHLHAGTVGLVGLLNPVTGVLLGAALASEVLSLRQVAGALLVVAGVLLGQRGDAGRNRSEGGSRQAAEPGVSGSEPGRAVAVPLAR